MNAVSMNAVRMPYDVTGWTLPYQMDVEVDAAQLAQAAAIVPGVSRTADTAVTYTSPSAWDMIRCFKVVCTMISAAAEEQYG